MRDVRTLRTLALLDLESHPPAAAIDRVTIVIDPTPGRVLQHTLFTRAHPTPEQLSTLLARLGALMGQDRIGAPAVVDSYRPGRVRDDSRLRPSTTISGRTAGDAGSAGRRCVTSLQSPAPSPAPSLQRPSLRSRVASSRAAPLPPAGAGACRASRTAGRCASRPIAAALPADASSRCAGPVADVGRVVGTAGRVGQVGQVGKRRAAVPGGRTQSYQAARWDRDEWDVALSDGAMYRIFRDRDTDGWFIDAIVD